MDFSRLHMYTPPQCVPENTGYTYALSSSYSSDALAFETEHRLDPVFDSPRMSRRSLRLVTTACATEDGQAGDAHSCASSTTSLKDRAARTAKQRRSASKPAVSVSHASRQALSSAMVQGGIASMSPMACEQPPVLDESLIREQTKVDHFWGLDDDGDLRGGNKAAAQGNGDLAAEAFRSNGYTCRDCALLSEHKATLPARPAPRGLSWQVCSTDGSQKHESASRKAHSGHCGTVDVGGLLREDGRLSVNGESLCHLLVQMLQRIGASGWFVSKTLLSILWLAAAAPGKAASGIFWWLGIGWYQFVTLISWLNVFLLTRCLRNICKFLILFIPLLLLLGAGLSLWGQGDFLSGFPVLSWTRAHGPQRADGPTGTFAPDAPHRSQPPEGGNEAFSRQLMSEVERQVALMSGRCHGHDQQLRELAAVLQKLQARVDQLDGDSQGTLSLTASATFRLEQESRISRLEDVLGTLAEKFEAIQKELQQTRLRTASGLEEEQRLHSEVKRLGLELGRLRLELSDGPHSKTSCEEVNALHGKVDARVRETIRLLFSDEQGASLEWLLQKLSSRFVSKDALQVVLQDLELQILKNVTRYISVTKQAPDSETVLSAVHEAGVSGITEAQAHVIVNNALKLYSQDKTGMVDFALESGGGSILSTRCSETYETKTALISLFGIPLWYFSQSPRVVIQPDIYPGNCWAFKGSQGYLVVRLSMEIRPTTFTLEHIPKTLSPTGNITSAPKDFAVYGLENEHQEEGRLLGRFTYDQDGESLQMFHTPKRPERAFQIVELRVFSNWGHPEYTCLYRFRVHGEPIE
ncbi:SUN domain-containing protein 1 isoform X8 [Suricata suricatta]|uniref:SUN domain-containing protein 1 isoform X8 n=1 Tax=Suricata suricatta TaxID=37032 RepID=UPI0011557143|nr:SUN domain-containing protein 1 isoform X8 [Suricata suricatta]